MKRTIIPGALLALALWPSAQAAETQSFQARTLNVTVGGELQFQSSRGDVEIRLWDRAELTVAARGIDARDLTIDQNGNLVRLEYEGRDRDVRFELQVPARFNLDLRTGGGDVSIIGNLQGRLALATQGGDIEFGDVDGQAKIKTYGGDIDGGSIAGDSEIETLGGDIEIGFVDGTLDVSTQGGDISIRGAGNTLRAKTFGGDVEVGDVAGEADLSTLGGDVIVGRVSGRATLKTSGGDIELRSSSGDVVASTAGGDIELREVAGSVEARTAGGDIDAELAGSAAAGSVLVSRGGDITLRLPGAAGFTVQAKIRLRGDSNRERSRHRFISDFPQASAQSGGDEMTATYQINGGGGLITLETTNGSIRILRSR